MIRKALIRVGLVFMLPIPIFLVVLSMMGMTLVDGLSIGTISYARGRVAVAQREAVRRL